MMKLYFYFLDTPYNEEPFIRFEECEVIEKPKTYCPAEKFPNGFYGSYVKKSDIGHLSGYHENIVVLTEKNKEAALNLFKNKEDGVRKRLEKEIADTEAKLRAIEKFRNGDSNEN